MDHKLNWKICISLVLKDYCSKTSVPGFKYLAKQNKSRLEKCSWFVISLTTLSMTLFICNLLLNDYNEKVTITTLENRKYDITNVQFPGIAICDINRISRKQVLIMVADMHKKMNVSEKELFELLKIFGKLYDFDLEQNTELEELQVIVDRYNPSVNTDYDTLISILMKLSPICNETLVRCKWLGEEVDCNEIFSTRKTMDGFCCTFNYIKSLDFTDSKNLNLRRFYSQNSYFKGAGPGNGLTVIVHSNPDDYYYPLISAEGLSVKIFNPQDYPDVTSGGLIENFIQLKHEVFIKITATTIKAVPQLKKVPVSKRGCLFDDEGKSIFDNEFYSYSDCLADCKLKSILALCECVPFFLPVLKTYNFSTQICTITDIPCLSKFKEKWLNIYPTLRIKELDSELENSLFCPQCLPSCFASFYSVDIDQVDLVNIPFKKKQKLDLNKHSVIHIYSDTEDTSLYESDVNYYWFDVVGNFGGACSLFLGLSLISIVEFLYFITIKYYLLLHNSRKHKQPFIK